MAFPTGMLACRPHTPPVETVNFPSAWILRHTRTSRSVRAELSPRYRPSHDTRLLFLLHFFLSPLSPLPRLPRPRLSATIPCMNPHAKTLASSLWTVARHRSPSPLAPLLH